MLIRTIFNLFWVVVVFFLLSLSVYTQDNNDCNQCPDLAWQGPYNASSVLNNNNWIDYINNYVPAQPTVVDLTLLI